MADTQDLLGGNPVVPHASLLGHWGGGEGQLQLHCSPLPACLQCCHLCLSDICGSGSSEFPLLPSCLAQVAVVSSALSVIHLAWAAVAGLTPLPDLCSLCLSLGWFTPPPPFGGCFTFFCKPGESLRSAKEYPLSKHGTILWLFLAT